MVSMIARRKMLRYHVNTGDTFQVSSARRARLLFKLGRADYENDQDRPKKPKAHVIDPDAPQPTSIFDNVDDGFDNGLDGGDEPENDENRQLGRTDLGSGNKTDGNEDPGSEDEDPEKKEIAEARAEYKEVFGKQPFMGWDLATLREKIAEKKAEKA